MIIRINKRLLFNMNKNNHAFTIVELLVVIVVIGILAAITIVSYSGISSKAIAVSLQSDLASDAKLLKMYNVEHGYYPNSIDNGYCPNAPEIDTRYCLKVSKGNTLTYTGGGQSFTLTNTHTASSTVYQITENGIAVAVVGEPDTNAYVYAFGGANEEYPSFMAKTSDNGFITIGTTDSYGAGGIDALISKFSSNGTLTWGKTWGGSGSDFPRSIAQTLDGGYILVGETESFGYDVGSQNAFITKLNSDGTSTWTKTWSGDQNSYTNSADSVIQTSDNGYIMVGCTNEYGVGGTDVIIAKYNSIGILLWSKTYGGVGYDYSNSIINTSDGGFAISGVDYDLHDAFITKFTSDGTLSWSKTWGGAEDDYIYSIVQSSDNGYAVTGYTSSYSTGDNDAFITKFTSDGTLSWSKTWGGIGNDASSSITNTSDNGFAITGYTTSFGAGDEDAFIAKLTSDGTLSWVKTWGGTGYDEPVSIIQSPDNGFRIFGSTDSYGYGGTDAFIINYNDQGVVNGCSSPMCQDISEEAHSQIVTSTDLPYLTFAQSPKETAPSPIVSPQDVFVTTIVSQ